jgi:cytochrome P450
MTAYSPLDPSVQTDPYPFYEELRRGPAATYLPDDDLWVVPHFEHVWQVARNPEAFSSKALRALAVGSLSTRHGPRPDIRDLDARLAASLIATDPPDHTRLRRLVSKPFTPSVIATLEPEIRRICNEAVDDLLAASERGEADLVRDLNTPLPILVIAAALGIPGERRADFKRWSNALVGQLDGGPVVANSSADLVEMAAYFGEVIAERSARPGDDLISWIIAGSADSAQPLTPKELIAFCTLLLIAGNETTTNLLGNAFAAFFEHPDQFEAMRAAEDLGPVVEEALRYDSPVQAIVRLTNGDVRIGDVAIPPDNVVMILFGSANRDERRWPDGSRFDVGRDPVDHVAFGSGIHHCLGAHLARLEARVAFDVIRTRVRNIEPSGPATRLHSSILRGLTSMPVRVEAA